MLHNDRLKSFIKHEKQTVKRDVLLARKISIITADLTILVIK